MRRYTLTVTNHISEIEKVHSIIEQIGTEFNCQAKTVFELNLAIDELLTNTISYGYDDKSVHTIEIEITVDAKKIIIKLQDDAKPFNPLNAKEADTTLSLEERSIGGLGIHIIKKIIDHITYERENNKNIISLTKFLLLEKEQCDGNNSNSSK